MQIKIGKIYKVKPGFKDECKTFSNLSGVYIRYQNDGTTYEILDKSKNCINFCKDCFKREHLEPVEKNLYDLEIGDELMDNDGRKQKVLGLIESSPENPIYILSSETDFQRAYSDIWTAYQLKNKGFTIAQPEPSEEIKEMTVEEVSKLIGKRVKIVE